MDHGRAEDTDSMERESKSGGSGGSGAGNDLQITCMLRVVACACVQQPRNQRMFWREMQVSGQGGGFNAANRER